jgi:hypothetical protein
VRATLICLGKANTLANAAALVSLALDAIRAPGTCRRDYQGALRTMTMNRRSMTDQELLISTLRKAHQILGEYFEPGTRDES